MTESGREPVREQRVAAYGLLVDADSALVVVQADPKADAPARWSLPGGAVEHGESPPETVERELVDQTGLVVVVGDLVGVWSDMIEPSERERGVEVHSIAIVYEIASWTGELRDHDDDIVAWRPIGTDDDARMDFVRAALRVGR